MGIFVTALLEVNFAYLYQGRNLFAKYFSSQFIHVQDSPVFDMGYASDSVFEEIFTSVLEERFPEIESVTEHQKKAFLAVISLNRNDMFAILPTGHGKSIIFQLLPDVCKYLYLSSQAVLDTTRKVCQEKFSLELIFI